MSQWCIMEERIMQRIGHCSTKGKKGTEWLHNRDGENAENTTDNAEDNIPFSKIVLKKSIWHYGREIFNLSIQRGNFPENPP